MARLPSEPHSWSSIPQTIANFPVQILATFLTVFAVNRIWVTLQKLRVRRRILLLPC